MVIYNENGISIVNNGKAVQVRFDMDQILVNENAWSVYKTISAYHRDEKYARHIKGGYSFRPNDNFESLDALVREFKAVLAIVNKNTVLF